MERLPRSVAARRRPPLPRCARTARARPARRSRNLEQTAGPAPTALGLVVASAAGHVHPPPTTQQKVPKRGPRETHPPRACPTRRLPPQSGRVVRRRARWHVHRRQRNRRAHPSTTNGQERCCPSSSWSCSSLPAAAPSSSSSGAVETRFALLCLRLPARRTGHQTVVLCQLSAESATRTVSSRTVSVRRAPW